MTALWAAVIFLSGGAVGLYIGAASMSVDRSGTLLARMASSLHDLSEDLEAYVEREYEHRKEYPTQVVKYRRDMEPIESARALLSEYWRVN